MCVMRPAACLGPAAVREHRSPGNPSLRRSPPNVCCTRAAAFSTVSPESLCAPGADDDATPPLLLVMWLPLLYGLGASFSFNDASPEDTPAAESISHPYKFLAS